MKIGRRVKRSRRLITSGIRLLIACLVLMVVALFFNMVWLTETVAIVAILVAIFIVFEYWSIKRFK